MDSAGGYNEYVLIADLYDYVIPYQDRPDVAFYVEAAVGSGGPVLEIGCGTGRVLIPTARADVEIVGMDLSTHMLEICRQRLGEEPEDVQARVELIQADMRDFKLKRTFQMATIPFRPFQHLLTVDDQLACLASIHRHLVEDGRLVFHIFNPSLHSLVRDDLGQEVGEEPEFTTPDGRRVIRRHKVTARDLFKQVNHVELIYNVTHPDGREERLVHAFPMRYFYRYEVEHLLVRAGYAIERVYADFDRSPYGSIYPGDLIFVARKVGEGV
jgi:SAM-dependent methyltransferase